MVIRGSLQFEHSKNPPTPHFNAYKVLIKRSNPCIRLMVIVRILRLKHPISSARFGLLPDNRVIGLMSEMKLWISQQCHRASVANFILLLVVEDNYRFVHYVDSGGLQQPRSKLPNWACPWIMAARIMSPTKTNACWRPPRTPSTGYIPRR
jgi:hypothetical protein